MSAVSVCVAAGTAMASQRGSARRKSHGVRREADMLGSTIAQSPGEG
jgi:hypothetical protein